MSVHTRGRRTKSIRAKVKKSALKKSPAKEKCLSWKSAFNDLIEKHSEGGLILKSNRIKKEISQKYLAEAIGINQHHISEIENGKRPIGKEMAKRFAEFFDTDYRIFL